ncbi:antiterminator, partial [Klebsiella pneumoniae]
AFNDRESVRKIAKNSHNVLAFQ